MFPGAAIGNRMQVGNSRKHKGTQRADEGDQETWSRNSGKYLDIRVESISTMKTRQCFCGNCVLLYCGAGD